MQFKIPISLLRLVHLELRLAVTTSVRFGLSERYGWQCLGTFNLT